MEKNFIELEKLFELGVNLKKDLDIIPFYFVKTFNTDAGKKVLAYLASITLNRYLPASATAEELRYLEGQRYLVAFIYNMIKKGMRDGEIHL